MEGIKKYRVIGMMSGTSLDGVDLTCSTYSYSQQKWSFHLEAAKTYPYLSSILQVIKVLQDLSINLLQFKSQEIKYSKYLAQIILKFIEEHKLSDIDYLALHGHTIFHHPQDKITIQVTNLSTVAAITGIDTIGNFRQLDVMRGGQGAPLAPFGEQLFEGDIFINLGGVANIGCCGQGWDILYCNLFLNHFAHLISQKEFDDGGQLGRKGTSNESINNYLETHWRCEKKLSLERQIFEDLLAKLLEKFKEINYHDILATYYRFLANNITKAISQIKTLCKDKLKSEEIQVVCTGGGAHNTFLIELIKQLKIPNVNIVVPAASIVQFKEAILFGLLGVKYLQNIKNCSNGVGGMLVKGKN